MSHAEVTDCPSRQGGIVTDMGDSGPESTKINGVALSADDVVRAHHDGEDYQLRFAPDALAKLARTGGSRPLTDAHTEDPRAKVGEITSMWYDENKEQIRYRASLTDRELEERVNGALIDVSPRVTHDNPSDMKEDGDGVRVADADTVGRVEHLALVQNTARSGANTRAHTGAGPEPATAATPDATAAADAAMSSGDVPGVITDATDSPASRGGSGSAPDAEDAATQLAREAAGADAIVAAETAGLSVADWAEEKYGLDAGEYDSAESYRTDLAAAIEGEPVVSDAMRDADSGHRTDMDAVEKMARSAASPEEIIAANRGGGVHGASLTQHHRREHGVDPAAYRSVENLRSDLRRARNEGRK